MSRENERVVIRGNEFYEIDLECERRKREGKPCMEEKSRDREAKGKSKK